MTRDGSCCWGTGTAALLRHVHVWCTYFTRHAQTHRVNIVYVYYI